MIYKCLECNYITEKISNYNRHLGTISHKNTLDTLRNNEKKYNCNCGKSYKHRSSLSSHKKSKQCNNQNDKKVLNNSTNDRIDSFKKEIRDEFNQLKNSLFISQNNKSIVQHIYNSSVNNGSISNTSNIQNMQLISQANLLYPDAPTLSKIQDYKLLDHETLKDLIENIIYYHERAKLAEFLGTYLIKYYKKDDISEQSIHNTDIPRLNFIIKTVVNNKSKWKKDGKGVITIDTIVIPMLKYINESLLEYIKINIKESNKLDPCSKIYDKLIDNVHKAGEVECSIRNKSLEKDILRYIAPHLKLIKH